MKKLIIDLDNTLLNTSIQEPWKEYIKKSKDRKEKQQLWKEVYKLIPYCNLYEGIEELFTYIRSNNIPTVIVSNNCNTLIKKFVEYYSIPIIDYIGRFSINRFKPIIKPSPLPILKGVELLGGDTDNIISIGNEIIDIEASTKSRLTTVFCTWGNTEEYNNKTIPICNADYIIDEPLKLIPIIE